MKVVDGQKAPEQIVFHSRSNAWQVLGRSDEDSRLVFDGKGGARGARRTGAGDTE